MRNYYRKNRRLNEATDSESVLTAFDINRINATLKKYELSTDLLNLKAGMVVHSSVLGHRGRTIRSVRLSVTRLGPFSLIIDSYHINTLVVKHSFSERFGGNALIVNLGFDYKHTFGGGSNGKSVTLKWYGDETTPDIY